MSNFGAESGACISSCFPRPGSHSACADWQKRHLKKQMSHRDLNIEGEMYFLKTPRNNVTSLMGIAIHDRSHNSFMVYSQFMFIIETNPQQ
jgi:hypothetical protein